MSVTALNSSSHCEEKSRVELAQFYNILAKLGMDDLTYTHVSSRLADDSGFLINPFGYLFAEVTADNLVRLNFDGTLKDKKGVSKTGYRIHGDIYKRCPHINTIVHLHTEAGLAVSVTQSGLLPLSQFSYHFYNKVAYHGYDGLALIEEEGERIANALNDNNSVAAFMRNHGTLTVGSTVQEALFYTYYLEKACKTQLKVLSQVGGDETKLVMPKKDIILKAQKQMRDFEADLGRRDWNALIRYYDL